LKLIFTGTPAVECISEIKLIKPSLNFYKNKSLLTEIFKKRKITQNKDLDIIATKKQAGKTTIKKIQITIEDGLFQYFSSFGSSAKPLALYSIDNAVFDIQNNTGSVRIKSTLVLMPESRIVTTSMNIGGIFNLEDMSANAYIEMNSNNFAGLIIPEHRMYITYNEGVFSIDDSPFKQLLSLSGRYEAAKGGNFVLAMNNDQNVFMDFINKNFAESDKNRFIKKNGKYKPIGKVNIKIRNNRIGIFGGLRVKDGNRDLFRLYLRGSEKALQINNFYLGNRARFVELRGVWNYAKTLPQINGRINRVYMAGRMINANVSINYYAGSKYRLSFNRMSINNSLPRNFTTYLNFTPAGIDIKGWQPGMRVSGLYKNDDDFLINLDFTGYNIGSLSKITDIGPAWYNRGLSGKVKIAKTNGRMVSSGNIRMTSIHNRRDYYYADYVFKNDYLNIKSAGITVAGISLKGMASFKDGETLLDLVLNYSGRDYPVKGVVKAWNKGQRLVLKVGTAISLNGMIQAGSSRIALRLNGFSLHSLGLPVSVRGYVNLNIAENTVISSGNLALYNLPLDRDLARLINLKFNSKNRNVKLTDIRIIGKELGFAGYGSAKILRNGFAGKFVFSKNCTVDLKILGSRIRSLIKFNSFNLSKHVSKKIKGIVNGWLKIEGRLANPGLSADLTLRNAVIFDNPFYLRLKADRINKGFKIRNSYLSIGDAQIAIDNGFLQSYGKDSYRINLSAYTRYSLPMAKLSGRMFLTGLIGAGSIDVLLKLNYLNINNKSLANVASQIQYRDGIMNFLRKGPSGLTGVVDINKKEFSFQVYDKNTLFLQTAGKLLRNYISLYFHSENMQLSYLNFLPSVFKNAAGKGRLKLEIRGRRHDPSVRGFIQIIGGTFKPVFFKKKVEKFTTDIVFNGHKIAIKRLKGRVGKGDFNLTGSAHLRGGAIEDLNLRLRTDKKYGIEVNINDRELKSDGFMMADVFIKGNPKSPSLEGRIAIRNNEFSYFEYPSKSKNVSFVKKIRWNVEVTAMKGVKYIHSEEIMGISAVVKPQSWIRLRNRILDRNFMVQGRIDILRGVLEYINNDFMIKQPTYLVFKKTSRGFKPWLVFISELKMKDENREDITIFLSYAGSLSDKFKFHYTSDPSRPEKEILALLGVERKTDDIADRSGTSDSFFIKSTEILSLLGFKIVSKRIRKFTGLDVFSIRTPLVWNWFEQQSMDLLDPKRQLSLLRDTSFSLGKYLTPHVFVEYTLTLKENADVLGDLTTAHQFGVALEFDFLNFGYLYKPTEKSGFQDYEHGFEFKIRGKF
ncbi:MAG: translocation/assembly module TamB domain-containing protein, partial [Spirochaetes bacterium]|nr:translocation/assembly module TamB domain-containing protein [Spirochaetota bacterium]